MWILCLKIIYLNLLSSCPITGSSYWTWHFTNLWVSTWHLSAYYLYKILGVQFSFTQDRWMRTVHMNVYTITGHTSALKIFSFYQIDMYFSIFPSNISCTTQRLFQNLIPYFQSEILVACDDNSLILKMTLLADSFYLLLPISIVLDLLQLSLTLFFSLVSSFCIPLLPYKTYTTVKCIVTHHLWISATMSSL